MTKREAAIIGIYTGVLVGKFADMQAYAEELMGQRLSTMGMMMNAERLKELAEPDFMALEIR